MRAVVVVTPGPAVVPGGEVGIEYGDVPDGDDAGADGEVAAEIRGGLELVETFGPVVTGLRCVEVGPELTPSVDVVVALRADVVVEDVGRTAFRVAAEEPHAAAIAPTQISRSTRAAKTWAR